MNRPGAPGTVQEWPIPTEIWLIRPSTESPEQKSLALALRRGAVAAGMQVEETRCQAHSGHQGRRLEILPPEVVRKLYVRCHRAHVWVAALVGTRCKLDPSLDVDHANLVQLDEFVRCKANYHVVSRRGEVETFLASAGSAARTLCTGTDDARCLPLHAFAPGVNLDLRDDGGRAGFEARYRSRTEGRKKCWVDDASRTWVTAKAMHTLDELHVAGQRLPVGFHWDVQTPRRRTVLINGWQRWEATNNAYLNVHPDAHVRSTQARLVWSWEKPRPTRGSVRRKK